MKIRLYQPRLEGFPHPYPQIVSAPLDKLMERSEGLSFGVFSDIAISMGGYSKERASLKTGDNYAWFGNIIVPFKDSELATLFPWNEKPSFFGRTVSAYSTKKLEDDEVGEMISKIQFFGAIG